jgi:hypothetical protein
MKKIGLWIAGAAVALGGWTGRAEAQIAITPTLGAYIPASDFYELRDEADALRLEREATLALGLNVEYGWLRGTLAYASGARLTEDGVEGESEIGEGTLLVAAADLVLRPIPRIVIVQPYLLGGVGLKNTSYDFDSDGVGAAFPDDETDLALHVGLGADLMFGGIGVVAEFTDFISKDADDDWGAHDAFAMVGLKLRL